MKGLAKVFAPGEGPGLGSAAGGDPQPGDGVSSMGSPHELGLSPAIGF